MYQIPKFLKRELHFLLGSITLIPPTVSMKPSSYLKVTAIIFLIVTIGYYLVNFVFTLSQLQGVEWGWPGRREPKDEHPPAS